MGLKLPEGPLQNGRTYIYVRIWSGFPKSMDTAPFADVDNNAIEDVLGRVAAKWVCEAPVTLAFPEERVLAKGVLTPPTELLEALTPQTIDEIGTVWLQALMSKRAVAVPYWVILHAEESLELALAVVESLRADTHLNVPFEFKLVGSHEIAREQAVLVERDLLEWDARSMPFDLIAKPFHRKHHPLRRLRDNALKFSPIVAKMLDAELAAELARSATISAASAAEPQASGPQNMQSGGTRGVRAASNGRRADFDSNDASPGVAAVALSMPPSDAHRIRGRLTRPAAIEQALKALKGLDAFAGEWLCAAKLGEIGISSKSVHCASASGGWQPESEVRGQGTAAKSYSKARVRKYVVEKWTPKKR